MADDIEAIRDHDYRRWGQATLYEGTVPLTPAEQHRHTLLAALDEAQAAVERLFVEGQQAKKERSQHVAWLDDAKVMIATLEAEVKRLKQVAALADQNAWDCNEDRERLVAERDAP